MNKGKFFSGQPLFAQLLKLIPQRIFADLVAKYGCDRYCKTFDSWHHLITMLYAVFSQCTSIREVITGLEVAAPKLGRLKLSHPVRRSTLSDANSRRPEQFFADLFHALYHYFYPDSYSVNPRGSYESRLFINDSSTIKLLHDVLKGAGAYPVNGRKKGGIKAHVLIKADQNTPCLVNLTPAAANDRTFLSIINLERGSIITFDKGYANFQQFNKWTKAGINWVSRTLDRWIVRVRKDRPISEEQSRLGVLSDQLVTLGDPGNNKTLKIKARIIRFYDALNQREFSFVTNNTRFQPAVIAEIYRKRWQIELLFKRIKQRYPLRYFLGDSANAIKIQVWCVLIADLLIKKLQDTTTKKWAYSNLHSIVKQHLLTYVDLKRFLNAPEKALRNYREPYLAQLHLFSG